MIPIFLFAALATVALAAWLAFPAFRGGRRRVLLASGRAACRGASVELRVREPAPSRVEGLGEWVQVAKEGDYTGYQGGRQPFSFTRQVFDQLVRNFRLHPSYRLGPDERGEVGIVPWDFNHASERDPTAGDLPVLGAPAVGWTSDLDVRTGADGKAELWAYTTFLEPARSYIKAGQYKWASVAVAFEAIDPLTGENIGAVLTSIALTNQPFIEGMQELIAAGRGGAKGSEDMSTEHETPTETIARLRATRPGFAALSWERQCEAMMAERAERRPPRIVGRVAPVESDHPSQPLDVGHCAGRNATEKLMALVRARSPGITHEQAFERACELRRTHEVTS